ncbi:glycosyltransferase [Providencia rettgeri]|uniref:Glycosyltransferase n=1 Tax=Providencia rettgeri TaxID=587 RepID=A0AAW6URE5_PRORE|nr:glycosyltransferase [Providencia rettgeri]ELR5060103.1 glycosyltransferase [Providencia rettgeri]ELR5235891.1 glycosyltransferase [Providencia rettgeri]ELU1337258.1 glycosyltransferase [Providencia rettgeri]EMC2742564.1 glycosyltransferase [Providencia rettgeri]EMD6655767.1 glycosyltransferase [Providencia rettgeri]
MILILSNSLANGGGERVSANIANYLSKNNQVVFFTLEEKITYQLNPSIKIINLNRCRFGKFFDLLYQAYQLSKFIKKNNISFVQSHLYRSNFINIISKFIFKSKHFCQIVNHGDPYQYLKKGIFGRCNFQLIKFLYPKSNEIIVISKKMEETISNLINKDNNLIIRTVNNPYMVNDIIYLSNKKIDVSFYLPNRYIVTMGRVIKSKNFDLLIKVIKASSLPLVIIGDGPYLNKLKNLARELNVTSKIYFVGNLKNPFPILKNAVFYVGASESEGFPNAIIESLACSLPVVHSDCVSGPREILQPCSSPLFIMTSNYFEITPYGILYTTNNIHSLMNSIKFLIKNPIVLDSMRRNCLSRALDFDADNIINQYFSK